MIKQTIKAAGLILLLCCMLAGGCPQVDNTIEVLNRAISELAMQPSRWQTVLENTLDKVNEVGTNLAREAAKEIKSIINTAAGSIAVTAFCGVDFLGNRVKQQLEILKATLLNQTPNVQYTPNICMSEPQNSITAGRDKIVTYYGYDFYAFQTQGQFTVDVIYAGNNTVFKKNAGFVAVTTNYILNVDIQGLNFAGMNKNLGPQLVLKWKDANVTGSSALPILLAPEAPTPLPCTLAEDYWTDHTISEEGGGEYKDLRGFFLAGYQCFGDHCDNQKLYLAKLQCFGNEIIDQQWSNSISEENGRNKFTVPDGHLIAGIRCTGDDCDNIAFLHARLKNCTIRIDWNRKITTGWYSEEQGAYKAPAGYFIVGYECSGRFCDNRRFIVAPVTCN